MNTKSVSDTQVVQDTSRETENIKSGRLACSTSWWGVHVTMEMAEEYRQASLGSQGGPPARGAITLPSVIITKSPACLPKWADISSHFSSPIQYFSFQR